MKTQSVISLDPIDRNNKKRSGFLGRWFKTNNRLSFHVKTLLKTLVFGQVIVEQLQKRPEIIK